MRVSWPSMAEMVARASIAIWRQFADLDLSDARQQSFKSLHACFTRALKPGARPVDADARVLASPCDAIVGACGTVAGTELLQAKGFPYTLGDLLADPALVEAYRGGTYVTLRLTSSMYHRFHAPHDGTVERVTYISGDTWNVNPIALRRVERLFAKNERAVIRTRLAGRPSGYAGAGGGDPGRQHPPALPRCRDEHELSRRREIDCDAAFKKGDELGWFEHGSTIIVFAPPGFQLCREVREGTPIRMGRALMRLP